MKANPNSRWTTLVGSVFLLLLWLVPLAVSAQIYPLIYRLQQCTNSDSHLGMGPDWEVYDIRTFHYSSNDPLLVTSFDQDYIHNYDHTTNTYSFTGFTEYQQDCVVYSSPASFTSLSVYRISKILYDGYYLEDSYYHDVDAIPTLYSQRKYFYDDNMKLVRMARKETSPLKYWSYEYVLDSLGRRTDEVVTVSQDSLNWSPDTSYHYTYSGLPIYGNHQFEKFAPYTLESFTGFPESPPYMADQWVIESITVIGATGEPQTYPIEMSFNNAQSATASYYASDNHRTIGWNSAGLLTQNHYYNYTSETAYTKSFEYSLIAVSSSDPVNIPPALNIALHPNPTREFSKLSLSLPHAATVQVSTYNLRGQQVKAESFAYQPSNQSTFDWKAVDRQGDKLPAGIYFLRINAGTQSKTARVVVIH